MHSDYFKTLAALACDMQLDSVLPPADVHKWAWFKRYCIAVRVAQSLIKRTDLPKTFCMEVRKKFAEMMPQPPQSHTPMLVGGGANSLINSTTSITSSASSSSNPTPSPQPSCLQTTGCSSSVMANLAPSTSNLIQYIDSVMSLSLHESMGACGGSAGPSSSHALPENLHFIHEDHQLFKVSLVK